MSIKDKVKEKYEGLSDKKKIVFIITGIALVVLLLSSGG